MNLLKATKKKVTKKQVSWENEKTMAMMKGMGKRTAKGRTVVVPTLLRRLCPLFPLLPLRPNDSKHNPRRRQTVVPTLAMVNGCFVKAMRCIGARVVGLAMF